jgi:hypothetical protein
MRRKILVRSAVLLAWPPSAHVFASLWVTLANSRLPWADGGLNLR